MKYHYLVAFTHLCHGYLEFGRDELVLDHPIRVMADLDSADEHVQKNLGESSIRTARVFSFQPLQPGPVHQCTYYYLISYSCHAYGRDGYYIKVDRTEGNYGFPIQKMEDIMGIERRLQENAGKSAILFQILNFQLLRQEPLQQ